ncbi:MAG TPA: excinuclease ABC subunit UvrA [Lacipirellulaceae bacterium]|nr:excinuclease ABC subunit UvrA [Lacipirellulaceae bacterium]
MSNHSIDLRGVAVNNLRHVNLNLPHRQLIVFCGVSGSGKTSMALDTLYAEGQRRYIESFSAYTRQFLEQLDKPQAERIEGIPPAIAVTHKNPSRSNRATVGTTTEVNDYLGLLFARVGEVICYRCAQPVRCDSPESAAERLDSVPCGVRIMVGFEATVPKDEPVHRWLAHLNELGYVRAVVGKNIEPVEPKLAARLEPGDRIVVVLDRLMAGEQSLERVRDSLETAFDAGDGACVVFVESGREGEAPAGPNTPATCRSAAASPSPHQVAEIDGRHWQRRAFRSALRCEMCGIEYPEPEPQLFNFNRPLGACPECEGFGNIVVTDMDRVVPDPTKTIREGAIAPWNAPSYTHELAELLALADDYDVPVDAPFSQLSEDQRRIIVEGVPERNFGGLNGFFRWLERRKYKMHLRVFLSRWRKYLPCPACGGARLRPEALAVQVGGKNFAEVCRLEIRDASAFLEALQLPKWQQQIARPLLNDVQSRLKYLVDVGLHYLALDRSLRTLSGGEAQRVALTATLGSSLVDMLYVLDEPSVGLHAADVEPLAAAIQQLQKRGNSVIVVEHEEEIIRQADHVVEFGPGAGEDGGRIVFQGTPQQLEQAPDSRTGDWLAGRRGLGGSSRRPTSQGWVKLRGARGNNLQNVTVEFPLGVLCLVTGVSGAGKSTLVDKTLYPALARQVKKAADAADLPQPLTCYDVLGAGQLEDVIHIDQSPIGRSPRSNPATYIKAFDPIRALFAEQLDARTRGLTAGQFSFNVEGGRCESCRGDGYLAIDMQFMADVYMRCPDCHGLRYRQPVLDVKYRGRNIAEVLDMTAREAFTFFRGQRKVQAKLKHLLDVGLDYLRLGQPATTLSGGEAQRLKLAAQLAAKRRGRTLFLLDEPTTGLHFSDIVQLIDCFDALLEVGHSLVVVEHNVQLMKAADWIVDLGPGAAHEGGRVVISGTPEEIAACEESVTGRVLAREFVRDKRLIRETERETNRRKPKRAKKTKEA